MSVSSVVTTLLGQRHIAGTISGNRGFPDWFYVMDADFFGTASIIWIYLNHPPPLVAYVQRFLDGVWLPGKYVALQNEPMGDYRPIASGLPACLSNTLVMNAAETRAPDGSSISVVGRDGIIAYLSDDPTKIVFVQKQPNGAYSSCFQITPAGAVRAVFGV